MPFAIVRNDIVRMQVDAVVNTANPKPLIGSGTDAGIHQAAGPELLEARKRIGDLSPGEAAVTRGYGLPAKYVIHTVGPVWQGGNLREEALLRSCYETSLKLAKRKGCQSVAFPLLCAGNCGFPKHLALEIAVSTIRAWLMEHEMQVYLVVFSKDVYRLSDNLYADVSSYIDEQYVREASLLENRVPEGQRRLREAERTAARAMDRDWAPCASAPSMSCSASLEDMLRKEDAGFSETLLRLIDKTGKKDAEIYKKANVDRKLFSKIRKNRDYRPSKSTALAFALALELDLPDAKDLIGRAGYALTHSSKFDIIVEYFILQKNYNVFQLNEVLFQFDQPLIGA